MSFCMNSSFLRKWLLETPAGMYSGNFSLIHSCIIIFLMPASFYGYLPKFKQRLFQEFVPCIFPENSPVLLPNIRLGISPRIPTNSEIQINTRKFLQQFRYQCIQSFFIENLYGSFFFRCCYGYSREIPVKRCLLKE